MQVNICDTETSWENIELLEYVFFLLNANLHAVSSIHLRLETKYFFQLISKKAFGLSRRKVKYVS